MEGMKVSIDTSSRTPKAPISRTHSPHHQGSLIQGPDDALRQQNRLRGDEADLGVVQLASQSRAGSAFSRSRSSP